MQVRVHRAVERHIKAASLHCARSLGVVVQGPCGYKTLQMLASLTRHDVIFVQGAAPILLQGDLKSLDDTILIAA